MVDNVSLRQVSIGVPRCRPLVSSNPPLLHTHVYLNTTLIRITNRQKLRSFK